MALTRSFGAKVSSGGGDADETHERGCGRAWLVRAAMIMQSTVGWARIVKLGPDVEWGDTLRQLRSYRCRYAVGKVGR